MADAPLGIFVREGKKLSLWAQETIEYVTVRGARAARRRRRRSRTRGACLLSRLTCWLPCCQMWASPFTPPRCPPPRTQMYPMMLAVRKRKDVNPRYLEAVKFGTKWIPYDVKAVASSRVH